LLLNIFAYYIKLFGFQAARLSINICIWARDIIRRLLVSIRRVMKLPI